MKKLNLGVILFLSVITFSAFNVKNKRATIHLIGDSSVADYSLEKNYQTKRFFLVGWG